MLFLRSLRNRIGAEEDNRAKDRMLIIGIIGLVSITISLQIKKTRLKMKANIKIETIAQSKGCEQIQPLLYR